jgi:hypothetical protein
LDLVNNPALALQPGTAYKIMSLGMTRGLFTGKKLPDYLNDEKADYVDARRIINGLDRAELIAGYSEKFEKILSGSLIQDAPPGDAESS